MFVCVFVLIFTGFPVAFALGGTALLFGAIGVAAGYFDAALLQAMPQRIFGVMSNFVLLAVPFFIFMGTMLEKSGLAEDLLKTIGKLFGPLRGGLALAVIFVGALLAAATGVVGASVVAMGLISLPIMRRYGYADELSAGVIAASGTLGQIIPPRRRSRGSRRPDGYFGRRPFHRRPATRLDACRPLRGVRHWRRDRPPGRRAGATGGRA